MKRTISEPEQLVTQLLAIPGPSTREQEVMAFLVERLKQCGADPAWIRFDRANRRSPFGGQCGNLILKIPGRRRGPRRMLMAHVDTVPLCQGARPVERDGYLVPADPQTALGADDRSGTAAILYAAMRVLRERPQHPPLTFLWTVQEEIGLYGARFADTAMLGRPTLAFNFDGGPAGRVTIGATGGYRMDIRISGLASHAGVAPEKGVSAITIAGCAIAELHRDGWLGRVEKGDRRGTSNIGVIHAGDATNVVTPEAHLRAEARSHDPRFRERIVQAIERAFRRAAKAVRNSERKCGQAVIEGRLDYEAFRLSSDDPSLAAAEDALRRMGLSPVRNISNGGLDANWMTAHGIPTVTMGCGQENMHTTAERLHLGEFEQACRVAWQLATDGG